MLRVLLLIWLSVSACKSPGASLAVEAEPLDGWVGHYSGHGSVGMLELKADGAYVCFVFNGMTVEGCATVAGAGGSNGTWVIENDQVIFSAANEAADLVVKLNGARAVRSEQDLLVTVAGTAYRLSKLPPEEEWFQSPSLED